MLAERGLLIHTIQSASVVGLVVYECWSSTQERKLSTMLIEIESLITALATVHGSGALCL